MVRVLATDGIDKSAALALRNKEFEVIEKFYEKDELKTKIQDVDVLVVRSATKVTKEIIDGAKNTGRLKLIIRAGVGLDNIDVNYAMKNGIKVMNTPNSSSISVAELAIGHMFAISRFINISNITMRNGQWEKKNYKGTEIFGKTLGLIGFGRIAREVAKRAKALGMKVVYTDIFGPFNNCSEEFYELDELLKISDYVSLHIPYDKDKGAVIGQNEIEKMKDGACIINCARGGVVNEKALLEALNTGKIAGAGIDVFEEEPTKNLKLINHPRVSATPHIGASTKEAQVRIGEEVVKNILDYFS